MYVVGKRPCPIGMSEWREQPGLNFPLTFSFQEMLVVDMYKVISRNASGGYV